MPLAEAMEYENSLTLHIWEYMGIGAHGDFDCLLNFESRQAHQENQGV